MFPLTEDSVSRLKYEHGKHVRDMERVELLSVPEDRGDGRTTPPLQSGGRGSVSGQSPGKGSRLPHRKATQPSDRPTLPLDHSFHGHGQPILLVLCGSRLRPLFLEVLLLFSLYRQAVCEWSRVRQASTQAAGNTLSSAGQRLRFLCRSPTTASHL